jgi:ferredoxin
MARWTINDRAVEAQSGDNVLGLARRHGLHVWFLCDGRGLCRTCECRVLSGGENLSPPSKIEREAFSAARLAEGFRLACQARVEGPGEVAVVSTAEQVRRQAVALDLPNTVSELARFSFDLSRSLPASAVNAVPQLIARPPTPQRVTRYVRDGLRMMFGLF